MSSPVHIAPRQLVRLIGTPSAPAIIDVRIDEDYDVNPRLIPGTFRHSHLEMDSLVERLDDRYPMVTSSKTPERGQDGHTLWVTRVRPKIDRIACPWLIRRFIDPGAKFLFVSAHSVLDVADRFNATPFDMEEVFWGHRGDQCTFDTMLAEWELDSEPLQRLATIVRAADTNRHDLAPEAAGLLAASLGLSRMYREDVEQLEAGLGLYDAFYRWARDASDEQHDWPGAS